MLISNLFKNYQKNCGCNIRSCPHNEWNLLDGYGDNTFCSLKTGSKCLDIIYEKDDPLNFLLTLTKEEAPLYIEDKCFIIRFVTKFILEKD